MTFLLQTDPERASGWLKVFEREAPETDMRIWPDIGDPEKVEYLATWTPPPDLRQRFPNLKALISTGAGVDQYDLSAIPPEVSVIRLVEPGIINGMVEYVTMSVLALHRDLFKYVRQQDRGEWKTIRVQPASYRTVGVLGLGKLGEAVASKVADFGFTVRGWSRSRRDIPGVKCFGGEAELDAFLSGTDILVFLLPLTDQTKGKIDAALLGKLPHGAKLVNVGRGQHLNLEVLRGALNSGQLSDAVLDVTDPEPLPPNHWIWGDQRVHLTPHIASMTQPETAAQTVIEDLRRLKRGEAPIGLVDRIKGY